MPYWWQTSSCGALSSFAFGYLLTATLIFGHAFSMQATMTISYLDRDVVISRSNQGTSTAISQIIFSNHAHSKVITPLFKRYPLKCCAFSRLSDYFCFEWRMRRNTCWPKPHLVLGVLGNWDLLPIKCHANFAHHWPKNKPQPHSGNVRLPCKSHRSNRATASKSIRTNARYTYSPPLVWIGLFRGSICRVHHLLHGHITYTVLRLRLPRRRIKLYNCNTP